LTRSLTSGSFPAMKVRDNLNFFPLLDEPKIVETAAETAVGETNPHTDAFDWKRETKSLGQVATPQLVAELMARWVMSAKPKTVLDPAAGLGSLLHECHRFDPHTKFVGVEFDQETLRQAKSSAPQGTKLILADYLLSNTGQFQGIIANPPYVKAHRLDYSKDSWRGFEERFGTPLDRLTNLYALFLLKIWEDLAPYGRAAVLLPAEFLNANFGEEIKKHLQNIMCPAGLIVFTPSLNLFADALTTSAIVFLEKGRPRSASSFVTKVESLEEAETFVNCLLSRPAFGNDLQYNDLKTFNPNDKWLNLLFNGVSPTALPLFSHKVGDYFDCRRGIATGANDFFCLSKSGLREHNLSLSHVVACVTKATDADGLVFSADKFDALAASDRRCYLLNPSHNGSSFNNYLQIGERAGIPKRHLPSHRPVWYLPENRAVADIWVAVFSRETIKFILNTSEAKNLTCFHGLYAKAGHKNLTPLVTLFLNSSWGRESFAQVNRFYGDGLNKLEPKDVESLPCPKLPPCTPAEAKTLVKKLAELELLPLNERGERVDVLISSFLDLPSRVAA
jgi:adenine-specific DNA-methyltransferase